VTGPWIAAFAALSALVVALFVVVLGLVSRVATVLEQAEARLREPPVMPADGLAPGSLVPEFQASDAGGRPVLGSSLRGQPSIYLLLSQGCEPCQQLAAKLRASDRTLAARLVAVVDAPAGPSTLELPTGITVLYDHHGVVGRAFASIGTPHAFAVDGDGRVVASAVPGSVDDLDALAGRLHEPANGKVPSPAPFGVP
jgi:hypothetical protein